jgi:GNAT superfamily N-acetyltransferase
MLIRKMPMEERYRFKVKRGIWNWGDDLRTSRELIVAESDGLVVGLITYVESSGRDPDYIGVGIVSVHRKFQGKGLARGMINLIFDQAWLLDKGVRVSPYTEQGKLKIKPIFEEFSSKYNIRLRH